MPAVEGVVAFHGNFRGRWRANPEIPDSQFIHTNTNFLSPIPMHLRIVLFVYVQGASGIAARFVIQI
jgi:hypothetical protein